MSDCCNYFQFTDPGDSFASWEGLRGPKGDPGPQGEPGQGLVIQGIVATVGDLPASANQGDVYLVGASDPYEGYLWTDGAWEDIGELAMGPQGPAGTITVGTVTGLPAGSTPTVVNTGTAEAAVLDFGIPAGADGQDGQDGVSPEVTIGTITGGHSVTITDADHPTGQSFNVMDGEQGETGPAGPGVAAGGAANEILVKQSAADYDTAWVTNPNNNIGLIENGDTASQNLAKGWYVIWKGSLYVATQDISAGTTLSASTNLSAVTIGGLNRFIPTSENFRVGISSSRTFTLASNSNGIIITTGTAADAKELIIYRCTDQGSVTYVQLRNAPYVSVTTGTNSITLNNLQTGAVLPAFKMEW